MVVGMGGRGGRRRASTQAESIGAGGSGVADADEGINYV